MSVVALPGVLRVEAAVPLSDADGLFVGRGLGMTVIGVGVGVLAALALTRFLSGMLYGVSVVDPLTFASVSILLVLVAALACYVPARRATRVDPWVALRNE